jgi:hypothetical protein
MPANIAMEIVSGLGGRAVPVGGACRAEIAGSRTVRC